MARIPTPCVLLCKPCIIIMERYRSGHNGADSKSVCAKAHEGSNPSLSAIAKDAKGVLFALAEREGDENPHT